MASSTPCSPSKLCCTFGPGMMALLPSRGPYVPGEPVKTRAWVGSVPAVVRVRGNLPIHTPMGVLTSAFTAFGDQTADGQGKRSLCSASTSSDYRNHRRLFLTRPRKPLSVRLRGAKCAPIGRTLNLRQKVEPQHFQVDISNGAKPCLLHSNPGSWEKQCVQRQRCAPRVWGISTDRDRGKYRANRLPWQNDIGRGSLLY